MLLSNRSTGCVREPPPHPFIPLPSLAPSFSPSLAPSSSSLGHWGEWAAILILIPLSLGGPLAERGDWSPGFWNAPPLSSGHWWRVKADRGKEPHNTTSTWTNRSETHCNMLYHNRYKHNHFNFHQWYTISSSFLCCQAAGSSCPNWRWTHTADSELGKKFHQFNQAKVLYTSRPPTGEN